MGRRVGVHCSTSGAALMRCSTLVSYSEVDEKDPCSSRSGEELPCSWKESAYSSMHTTPKAEKISKRERLRDSSCTKDGSLSSPKASKAEESDNWRLDMDQYRPEATSDSHCLVSVNSPDSGLGRNEEGNGSHSDDVMTVYEFEFPAELCGRLIGKGGRNLQQLMEQSNVTATVRKQPFEEKQQVVSVAGSHRAVERFLQLVQERFPRHRNPEVSMRQNCIESRHSH